jgi:hypothetical protein
MMMIKLTINPLMKVIFMKQIILIILLFCFTTITVSAQKAKTTGELTDKQWQDLFTALGNENWDTAFDLSTKYLKQLKDDDEAKSIGNLRYMSLYSAAGKVFEGKMSYDKLDEFVKGFVGKKLVFPYRQISVKCKGFNFVCPSSEAKNKAMVTAMNRAGTTILAFEYLQFKENFDFAKYDGKEIAVGGIAKSIVPNPNKSNIVILRIYISDGDAILPEQKEKKASEK